MFLGWFLSKGLLSKQTDRQSAKLLFFAITFIFVEVAGPAIACFRNLAEHAIKI
jgi:hypothetical protein